MSRRPKQVASIAGYHAHVYYDKPSRPVAERLRQRLARKFEVTLGRWHDEPVGPHPNSMYQVAFDPARFAALVPWLALNREGLRILVHPSTGDHLADHTKFAMWLGEPLDLVLEALE